MRLIVVHGTMGTPEGNWFAWLCAWAQERNIVCISPRFPTPRGQSLDEWYEALRLTAGRIGYDDILVGYGVGAAFVCRVLEHIDEPIRATFLVAPFARQIGNKVFDPYHESFVIDPFDWRVIRENSKTFYAYAGTNDPYVPLAFGREVAGALNIDLRLIDNGGHLNSEFGFIKASFLEADLAAVVEANGQMENSSGEKGLQQ